MNEGSGRRAPAWQALAGIGEFDGSPTGPAASVPVDAAAEIVFIDGSIDDAQALAMGVRAGVVAVVLDPGQDGVRQIAEYLSSHAIQGAAAVAIVAHGADGVIQVGSTLLSAATIVQHLPDLAQIGDALRPGGDILLYGCDIAQDVAGEAFLQQLARATGGANIAASSHVIGTASAGGDWNLDVDTGTIDVDTPFTPQALTAFADALPVATNQLFASFNHSKGNGLTRVEQLGVSGTSLVGAPVDIRDGTQTSNFAFLQGIVVDAPRGKYFLVNSDNSTVNQIVVGSITGGAPTVLYTAPDIPNYQFAGLALDQPNHTIYFAQASTNPAQDGIFKIDEGGGTATPVVVNQGIISPLSLSLDLDDGLVFFVDNQGIGSNVNRLDVGNLSTGKLTVLNGQLDGTVQTQIATKAGQLAGVAVDAPNNVLYFTANNGTGPTNNFIYRVAYTVTAGNVTLGSVQTLYSGSAAGHPGAIVLDTIGGRFYIGNQTTQAIDTGSLSGGGSVSQVFQLTGTVGVQPNGLYFLSTPTVAASGSVAFAQGGPAVILNASLTVANPDGQGLASATIQVGGGSFAVNGETLAANTAGTSITANYNTSNETLTLSGADTLAHYQTVLRSVTFSSTGATAGSRTINWTVSDGIISSTTPTSTVTVHDQPVVTAGANTTFIVNRSPVALDATLKVSDPDSAILNSATVSIGAGFLAGDTLGFSNQGGIGGNYAAGSGVLTLTGAASIATYQTALQSITYGFTGDPTGGKGDISRTISWSASDGVATSNPVNSTLNFDNAPTIVAGASVIYPQNGIPVALDPDLTIADPDNATLSGATVAITSGFLAGDTLNFSGQNGITGDYQAGTGVLTLSGVATVANYQTALRSIAYSFDGDPTNGGTNPDRTIGWTVSDGIASSDTTSSSVATLCFCAGTRIATPAGEVPVEALAVGDLVLTLRGISRPIRWIGTGQSLLPHGRRSAATPVIVRAHALGDGVPLRDLRITKGHSLFLEGVLVPVECLINHRTILWDDEAGSVVVYHIELDTHEVLLANGTPAESYRDDGNRTQFQNANPTWDERPPLEPCAPIVTTGPVIAALWQHLLQRAPPPAPDALTREPDLHLRIDGTRVDASGVAGDVHSFVLDLAGGDIRLASRSGIPAEQGFNNDQRRLGVAVQRIVLRQPGVMLEVAAASPLLEDGFHGHEPEGDFRWTDGAGLLPPRVLAAFTSGRLDIEVHVGCIAHYSAAQAALPLAA